MIMQTHIQSHMYPLPSNTYMHIYIDLVIISTSFCVTFVRFVAFFPLRKQIENVVLRDLQLGPGMSKHCAKSVFGLSRVTSLELNQVKLDDRFFAVMSEFAPKSLVII